MQQLGLFDALYAPAVVLPIDPDGHVVQGEVDEHYFLPHLRLAWHRAEIELHRHENGLWMWSASYKCDQQGSGYRVGPKWGKFAETRDDALFYAVRELHDRLHDMDSADAKQILTWADSL